MPLEIKYEIPGNGWGKCTIINDGKTVTVKGDYLSDGLGDMSTAIIEILTNRIYSKTYFEQDFVHRKYRVVFEWDSGNVQIKVGESCDNEDYEEFSEYGDEYYYKPIFECISTPAELLNAMLNCLQTVYETYGGARGYRKIWDEFGFPLKQLKQLKSIAKRKEKLICPIPDEVFTYWKGSSIWRKPFGKGSWAIWYKFHNHREAALEHVNEGLFNIWKIGETTLGGEPIPQMVSLKADCFLIAGIIYLWNGMFERALALEKFFLTRESQEENWPLIYDYLALLIGYGKREHLDLLFSDPKFKKKFNYAYDAYISYYESPDAKLHSQAWIIRNNAGIFCR